MKARLILIFAIAALMVVVNEPAAAAGNVIISEFVAANATGVKDNDNDYSDWIELYNSSSTEVDISGWYLTDNANNLKKWKFPAGTSLPANGYLIVFASAKDRAKAGSQLHTNFQLSSMGEYLGLVQGDGTTIAWEYAPQFPPQYDDIAYGVDSNGFAQYFLDPTPGALNGTGSEDRGPSILSVVHSPQIPTDNDPLIVMARVIPSPDPIARVEMRYRIMHGGHTTLEMRDDGTNGDSVAADGFYTAIIPADEADPGEMIRYYVTAVDSQGRSQKQPFYKNPTGSPKYFGTMVSDPAVTSTLPIFYWFLESPSAAETYNGTRGAVFFNGIFYDNVYIRLRGNSTSNESIPKKSFKFDFNKGHYFFYAADREPVEEVNLQSTYSDKSYVRPILAFGTFRDAGLPYSETVPWRVQQNGQFFSVAHFIEQVDETYLKRHSLDPLGAMYKMYNFLTSTDPTTVEKKTRLWEDSSDLQSLINGVTRDIPLEERVRYIYDNVDIPELITYMAITSIINDRDCGQKNYYVYRDTNGTGEWMILPWDKDLTFGRVWRSDTKIKNDIIRYQDHPAEPCHNRLTEVIRDDATLREMYYRRLRTLMDTYLQPPGTSRNQQYFESSMDSLYALMSADVRLDDAKWESFGEPQTFEQGLGVLEEQFLDNRRDVLYGYAPPKRNTLPGPQPNVPTLTIEEIDYNPSSGNQAEEYFEIKNPNNFAVDISGWTIRNEVEYTFAPGVVIPSNGRLYVSADVVAFRQRSQSPKRNQKRFVQGNYTGHLNNIGGVLELFTADGILITSKTYGTPLPTPQVGELIVTEINYNPLGGSDYEFIELKNNSTATLQLENVAFTEGIDYIFPADSELAPQAVLVLARDRSAFSSRYGFAPFGEFGGKLSNDGEKLTIANRVGTIITSFSYSVGIGSDRSVTWVTSPNGQGKTLVWLNVPAPPFHGDACLWGASLETHGTPGVHDPSGITELCLSPTAVQLRQIAVSATADQSLWLWIVLVLAGLTLWRQAWLRPSAIKLVQHHRAQPTSQRGD